MACCLKVYLAAFDGLRPEFCFMCDKLACGVRAFTDISAVADVYSCYMLDMSTTSTQWDNADDGPGDVDDDGLINLPLHGPQVHDERIISVFNQHDGRVWQQQR